ncbi:phage repressor protein [Cereibacter sphaeroides]|nr:phage repressor protein [Cereibacter sphaeroides]
MMNSVPSDPFVRGLRRYFEVTPTAKPATVSAEAGLNKSAIRKILDGQVSSPRHASVVAIARALNLTPEDIIAQRFERHEPTVSVAGRVGAGAVVHLVDDHAKGDGIYMIECPPQLRPNGIVAVEVEGDSMAPIYQPGDVLIYTREAMGVPSEAINRICVCEDDTGHAWVKQVRTGTKPGHFHLISANPTGENLFDVALKWAAPVRLHLPLEFVRRA